MATWRKIKRRRTEVGGNHVNMGPGIQGKEMYQERERRQQSQILWRSRKMAG